MSDVSATDAPKAKKTRAADVTVVVGGKEFQENSRHLRSSSDYFEAAFQSGMKEAIIKRFEFPDKDPKEWELIRELLMPLEFPSQKVTVNNLEIVASWFDKLCVSHGLKECDRYFKEEVLSVLPDDERGVTRMLTVFAVSVQYNLPKSKTYCMALFEYMFVSPPFDVPLEDLQKITLILTMVNEKDQKILLEALRPYLPPEASAGIDLTALIRSGYLPTIIHAKLKERKKKDQMEQIVSIMNEHRSKGASIQQLNMELNHSEYCKELLDSLDLPLHY